MDGTQEDIVEGVKKWKKGRGQEEREMTGRKGEDRKEGRRQDGRHDGK